MAQMRERVTTYHLELTGADRLVPGQPSRLPYTLARAEVPLPELNRFLYAAVGAQWGWYMRLGWTYSDWRAYLERDAVGTWIAYVQGTPAGYFELERQPPGSVEVVYFGLLPPFVGRGMGSALLTDAVRTAWKFGGSPLGVDERVAPEETRVWLHTCTLDHPAALPNYQARGFRIFETVETTEEVPDAPLEPWPGAGRVW
jgi:GNAT superfamily N-acetyltransferase